MPEPKPWAKIDFVPGSTYALCDTDGDGRQELWVLRAGSTARLEQYEPGGGAFILKRTWALKLPPLQELLVVPQKSGEVLVAGATPDGASLHGAIVRERTAKPLKPYKFKTASPKQLMLSKEAGGEAAEGLPAVVMARRDTSTLAVFTPDQSLSEWKVRKTDLPIPAEQGELRLGDYNGDGREDVLCYDDEQQLYSVYLQTPEHEFRLLSTFGPWGRVGGKLVTGDLDGNGKCDIALIERGEPFTDTALSYETAYSPAFTAP
jgi:nitrogen fixation protein